MPAHVDLFWSFRSPYSYLAMPGALKLEQDFDVELGFRPVLPLARRDPAFLSSNNLTRGRSGTVGADCHAGAVPRPLRFACYAETSAVALPSVMSNLSISVDGQLIKRARVRAIEQGTSLSAKVREFLQEYVNESPRGLAKLRAEATARLMAAMDAATSKKPPAPKYPATKRPHRTLREELYAGDFRASDRKTVKAGEPGNTRPVR